MLRICVQVQMQLLPFETRSAISGLYRRSGRQSMQGALMFPVWSANLGNLRHDCHLSIKMEVETKAS